MVKINFEVSEMTFAEALNAALDVAGHCRKVPVMFVFQGVKVELVCVHENVCAPHIVEPRMITDFSDDVLFDEFHKRVVETFGNVNHSIDATQLFNLLTYVKRMRNGQ